MSREHEVLTERQLNRAVLARQMLLERAQCSIPEALERMGGLQAQYAPSAYVGLWSRIEGFERRDLNQALEDRTVVQGTLMRLTIHLVSASDYFLFAEAVREPRREWWLKATKGARTEGEMRKLAGRTRRMLSDGPKKRSELLTALGIDNFTFVGVGLWVDLVRVPPSGTWEHRRADLYGLADSWLGPLNPSAEEGTDHLIRRYLAAFGPARPSDIVSWSGLPAPTVAESLTRLDLRRLEDTSIKELVDVPNGPLPDPETRAPIRFLGTWDALLLVHARRTQVLPERHRARVFHTKNPQSVNTFTVDGRVAGSWRHSGSRIRIEPFEDLAPAVRRGVDSEAKKIAALF